MLTDSVDEIAREKAAEDVCVLITDTRTYIHRAGEAQLEVYTGKSCGSSHKSPGDVLVRLWLGSAMAKHMVPKHIVPKDTAIFCSASMLCDWVKCFISLLSSSG